MERIANQTSQVLAVERFQTGTVISLEKITSSIVYQFSWSIS